MEYITLNNGVKMPQLGFGVCRIPDLKECEAVVLAALRNGYRSIDTAANYFNEEAVGAAIKKSGIPRDELFLTTKLWCKFNNYEDAKREIQVSLDKLGTDYIDLYLIHRPVGDYYGAYRAMTEFYKAGKIRAIGVSNFFDDRLVDLIIHQEVVPAVNQMQCHPFLQRDREMALYRQYGVKMECWSPFAVGANGIFSKEVLTSIGKKYGKSVAQVILRWHIERGCIVIPKTIQEKRMQENMDVWDFELTETDMQAIKELDLSETNGAVDESAYRLESLKRALGVE